MAPKYKRIKLKTGFENCAIAALFNDITKNYFCDGECCKNKVWSLVILLFCLVLVAGRPQEFEDDDHDDGHSIGNRKDDVSRVQIKVYRGPTKHDGYAPWGFWVKQPSDDQ